MVKSMLAVDPLILQKLKRGANVDFASTKAPLPKRDKIVSTSSKSAKSSAKNKVESVQVSKFDKDSYTRLRDKLGKSAASGSKSLAENGLMKLISGTTHQQK